MQLQRFLLPLALPLLVSLSACIVLPGEGGHEEAFKDEGLTFIEIGKSTKEEIAAAMSDFPMETDEGKVRVNLTPQKFRGGDWWLYAQTRNEFKWVIGFLSDSGGHSVPFGGVDYRLLLIKYDNKGIVVDYELSTIEGLGCNVSGFCVQHSRYNLLASEDEDRIVKQFDIPAGRCGVYVYVKRPFGLPIWSEVPIWLDGHRAAWLLDKKQFVFWQLDQGVYNLAPHSSYDPAQRQIEFHCAAEAVYFFELERKHSGFFRQKFWVEIEQRDAVQGRKAIGKRQLTLNVDESTN